MFSPCLNRCSMGIPEDKQSLFQVFYVHLPAWVGSCEQVTGQIICSQTNPTLRWKPETNSDQADCCAELGFIPRVKFGFQFQLKFTRVKEIQEGKKNKPGILWDINPHNSRKAVIWTINSWISCGFINLERNPYQYCNSLLSSKVLRIGKYKDFWQVTMFCVVLKRLPTR